MFFAPVLTCVRRKNVARLETRENFLGAPFLVNIAFSLRCVIKMLLPSPKIETAQDEDPNRGGGALYRQGASDSMIHPSPAFISLLDW